MTAVKPTFRAGKTGVICALFALLLVFAPHNAHAQLAVKQADIQFGTSEAPIGGTGTNRIGTNGNITYAAGYSGPASGTAGRILLQGTNNRRTQISCEVSKTARNVGGTNGNQDSTVTPIYLVMGTANIGAPGTGLQCAGLGNNIIDQNQPAAAAARTIYIGADMNVASMRNGGTYAFSNAPTGQLIVRFRQFTGGPPIDLDVTVDLSASFTHPVTLTPQNDIDFGDIEKAATVTGADRANLGTNGAITYNGNFNGGGTGTAGSVLITGVTNGVSVAVYCDTSAQLRNLAGTSHITLNNIQVDPEDSLGAFGTASNCNGVSGAAALTFTYQATTRDQIYFGGRLDGATASGTIGGLFSTSHPSGNPLDITVVLP